MAMKIIHFTFDNVVTMNRDTKQLKKNLRINSFLFYDSMYHLIKLQAVKF